MTQCTNIRIIMDRLTRHPMLQELPFETVVDYTVDFIRIMGMPPMFDEKTAIIDINDYRGELPCDFYEMIQVKMAKGHLHPWGDSWWHDKCWVARYSTDSFHFSEDKSHRTDFTYKLQGHCIFVSLLEKGRIEIAYRAMVIDDEGYPAIPDNSPFLRALEAYIKKQWFTIQFDLGKINYQVMAKAEQDYGWAVGNCHTELAKPTIDQMQSIANMWNTLIPRANNHRHGFIHEGSQEHIKTH